MKVSVDKVVLLEAPEALADLPRADRPDAVDALEVALRGAHDRLQVALRRTHDRLEAVEALDDVPNDRVR